jgi:hypothetical protein
MAFTRFHDDPCRIQKYLEESTYVGNYEINVPGNSDKPSFINDPYLRMQKWGANLSENKTELESDLMGITRKLNRDSIQQNNYLDYNYNNNLYNQNIYPVQSNEITHQPRATNPHVCIPFHNNISSRIVEKDYYSINTNYKN